VAPPSAESNRGSCDVGLRPDIANPKRDATGPTSATTAACAVAASTTPAGPNIAAAATAAAAAASTSCATSGRVQRATIQRSGRAVHEQRDAAATTGSWLSTAAATPATPATAATTGVSAYKLPAATAATALTHIAHKAAAAQSRMPTVRGDMTD
jgi:hypothetical protein